MPNPIRFVFAVHLHQPAGNFDSVFQPHLDEVYQPFTFCWPASGGQVALRLLPA